MLEVDSGKRSTYFSMNAHEGHNRKTLRMAQVVVHVQLYGKALRENSH